MQPSPAYRHRMDWRHRAPALILSLALVGLIVLALMRLGLLPGPDRKPEAELNTFDVPPGTTAAAPERTAAADRASPRTPGRDRAAPAAPRPVPTPAAPEPPLPFAPGVLVLDKGGFAATDIGRLPSSGAGAGDGAAGADTATVYGPGEGPGGERLFNAEWQREPSRAELAGYLPPAGAPAGAWATIACRTVERYQVENCRSLGEFPAGSGLARAMRQAAWQFRVRPPRVGGRVLIGAWVRIRISFTTDAD